jgi:type II secretory pathway pseudopilin PulG
MNRRVGSARAQRGFALLALLAVIVMVFAYVITSRLNAASGFVARDRDESALALARAKQALIGYVAQQASLASESNPGRLPCPEAPANYGTANEGIAAGNCALPAVGRLPWRTLGLEKLVDAAGEPLWYVVSPGWALPTSTSTTLINPDSPGQLTVDGVGNDSVALIIAPGPAIVVQTATGCTAWTQVRAASGAPDKRNYLECGNTGSSFVTGAPGKTFNDQVLRVTAADIMPALGAAVQERMQREIAPAILNARFALDSNSPRRWVSSTSNPPVYPYPVPFTTPTTSLSNFRGATGTSQGLLPFAPVSGFVSYQSVPPNVVQTSSAGSINSVSCYWESATVYACEGLYVEDSFDPTRNISVQMTATFTNVAMGFRTRNTAKLTAEARNDDGVSSYSTSSVSTTRRLEMNDGSVSGKPRGSVTVTLSATLPNIDVMGWGSDGQFRLRIDRAVIADHCLLSTTTGTSCAGSDTSWFARNEWYRNVYYAVADQNIPDTLPSVTGCDSTNCLRFNDDTVRNTRVLLVIAGRKLDTQTRPSSNFADYIEYQNADSGTYYEQHRMRAGKVVSGNSPWNDRLVVVDWISPAPTFPIAYLP